jgi:hypothetical protein
MEYSVAVLRMLVLSTLYSLRQEAVRRMRRHAAVILVIM